MCKVLQWGVCAGVCLVFGGVFGVAMIASDLILSMRFLVLLPRFFRL